MSKEMLGDDFAPEPVERPDSKVDVFGDWARDWHEKLDHGPTPGPWKFQPAAEGVVEEPVVLGPNDEWVAHCVNVADGEIVALAPEILERLKQNTVWLRALIENRKWDSELDFLSLAPLFDTIIQHNEKLIAATQVNLKNAAAKVESDLKEN